MTKRVLLALAIGTALLGMADAWYLFQSAVTDTALACDIGGALDGCNVVAQSPYSYLFGLPLALYGVGFYALMFTIAALMCVFEKRLLYKALYVLGIAGCLASLGFLYIQFVLIQALCIYCLFSVLASFLLGLIAYRLWKHYAPPELVSIL